MPLAVFYPYRITKKIRLELPKTWNIAANQTEVDCAYFYFNRIVKGSGKIVEIAYEYYSKVSEIPAMETKAYLDKAQDVKDSLSQVFSPGSSGSRPMDFT